MTNKAERKKATRIASESDQVLDFQKRLQKKLMKKKKNQVGILELKSITTEIKKNHQSSWYELAEENN